jgi:hypothetical protein
MRRTRVPGVSWIMVAAVSLALCRTVTGAITLTIVDVGHEVT